VDLIVDASSIINLHNAQALELVTTLPNCVLWLSPLVVGECHPKCAAELLRLKRAGLLGFVDSDKIPADSFLELVQSHGLGDGETECLALCLTGSYIFCCDDSKARQTAIALFGGPRVVGSLRLLVCRRFTRHRRNCIRYVPKNEGCWRILARNSARMVSRRQIIDSAKALQSRSASSPDEPSEIRDVAHGLVMADVRRAWV